MSCGTVSCHADRKPIGVCRTGDSVEQLLRAWMVVKHLAQLPCGVPLLKSGPMSIAMTSGPNEHRNGRVFHRSFLGTDSLDSSAHV